MLEKIIEPVVYFAGPNVFCTKYNELEFAERWGMENGLKIVHPIQFSGLTPLEIKKTCEKAIRRSDVVIVDCNDFRGNQMDEGTAYECSIGNESGVVLVGYKRKKEDPVKVLNGIEIKPGVFVDKKGFIIDTNSDRNVMIIESIKEKGEMFYGDYESVFNEIAEYINDNVKNHYWHNDRLIGRKLMPPNTSELFQTLTPNIVVELTRFIPIIEHPKMRVDMEKKQLGALFWVYPDATHTRYGHALGTMAFTEKTLEHLPLDKDVNRHI